MRANLRPLSGLVVWGLLIVIGLAMASCAAAAAAGPAEPPRGAFWCFSARVKDKRGKLAAGCFDSPKLCAAARSSAVKYGGLVHASIRSGCEATILDVPQ